MIKKSLQDKLEGLERRLEEIDALLGNAEVCNDRDRYRQLARERAELEPVVSCFRDCRNNEDAIGSAMQLTRDADPGIRELAQAELKEAKARETRLRQDLHRLLLPRDPDDAKNIFLEIRAGAGGREAALFAGDLMRMYCRYAEARRWRVEVVNSHPSELDGYREVVLRIIGKAVYSRLKFESGVHRVQRVPETEAQGRIHTSTCTVAVLPEAERVDRIEVQADELRIDTFRASGAGGQHVNKTDSAIRILHLPTGTVVECQDERSQHKNRAKAMALLQARLLAAERGRQAQERAESRRLLVGSGARSERIRTYNFPQNRMTDHRIQLTLHQLGDVLLGKIDAVIEPLISEYQAQALSAAADSAQ